MLFLGLVTLRVLCTLFNNGLPNETQEALHEAKTALAPQAGEHEKPLKSP